MTVQKRANVASIHHSCHGGVKTTQISSENVHLRNFYVLLHPSSQLNEAAGTNSKHKGIQFIQGECLCCSVSQMFGE